MKVKNYTFPSASGLCDIKAWQWLPDDENIKAVIQFHHGMAEHSGRYKETMHALTSAGYAVFMHDMLNHGKSNNEKNILGYFGDNDGYKFLLADTKSLYDIAKNEYPDKVFVIAGHSMGSFVMRCFLTEYEPKCDGAVFIGSSGPNPMAGLSVVFTSLIGKFKGRKYKSKFLENAGFMGYNKRFEKRTNSDWLSRDTKSVDEYIADEKCGFTFSVAAYRDLVELITMCNKDEWFDKVPVELPIFIMAGEEDPVGDYGKSIKGVYDKLIETRHVNATIKLYPECRHEILGELNKEEVWADLNDFIVRYVL